jgi:malonyl CoA-acyl carrier protein transacylase
MAAIAATADVVARYVAEMGLQDQISIAVYNAADNNVVSGDLKAIEKLMAAVKRDGMRATKLAVAQGEHLISNL